MNDFAIYFRPKAYSIEKSLAYPGPPLTPVVQQAREIIHSLATVPRVLAVILLFTQIFRRQLDQPTWSCHVDSWQSQGELDVCAKAIDRDPIAF